MPWQCWLCSESIWTTSDKASRIFPMGGSEVRPTRRSWAVLLDAHRELLEALEAQPERLRLIAQRVILLHEREHIRVLLAQLLMREAIRGDQRPSEAIRGDQRSSAVIRGHQKLTAFSFRSAASSSAAPRGSSAVLGAPSASEALRTTARACAASRAVSSSLRAWSRSEVTS